MQYPKINFSTPGLDYELIEELALQMRADVLSQGDECCKSVQMESVMCRADVKREALQINKDSADTERYERNVRELYLLLYPYADDYNASFTPVSEQWIDSEDWNDNGQWSD